MGEAEGEGEGEGDRVPEPLLLADRLGETDDVPDRVVEADGDGKPLAELLLLTLSVADGETL